MQTVTERQFAARWAWLAWMLSLGLITSSLYLDFHTPDYLTQLERPGPLLDLFLGLLSLASATIGAIVAARLPRNPIGWTFCGMGLLYGSQHFFRAYADYALLVRPWLPLERSAAWFSSWSGLWGLVFFGTFAVLLLPAGRLPSRRWRPIVWMTISGSALFAVGETFRSGPSFTHYVNNPIPVTFFAGDFLPANRFFELSSIAGGALLSAGCLAALVSLALRPRPSGTGEHGRFGWLAVTAVPALAISLIVLLDRTIERLALLFAQEPVWLALWATGKLSSLFGMEMGPGRVEELRLDANLELLAELDLLALPVCVGVAIFRHQLYGIDFSENRIRVRASRVLTLSWPRILAEGVGAGALPLVLVPLTIYSFVVFHLATGQGMVGGERLAEAAAFVREWGARAFFVAASVMVASHVARRARERTFSHGVSAGLVAAVANRTVTHFFYSPTTFGEVSAYLLLGAAAGWLGGLAGSTTLVGEVYRASQQISLAEDPAAVAAAIGENLGGSRAHSVALWIRPTPAEHSESGDPTREDLSKDAVLQGSWIRRDAHSPFGVHPHPIEIPYPVRRPARPSSVLKTTDLPVTKRGAWERQGIHSILLLPLTPPGEAWTGLLMVTFRKKRRLSRSLMRAYLTVSVQAALALENLRLVEEARQAGRRAGILTERQRLARDLHDTLAQGLTSIIMSLSAEMSRDTERDVGRAANAGRAAPTGHLEEARRTARENLAETRRLVWALRPESLDRNPLPEALDSLAENWAGETGVETRAVTSGTPRPLLPEVEVALLRTAQEAFANVRKHARATRVNITLSYMGDRVILDVLDDGVGFDPAGRTTTTEAQDTGGFGLTAMRERVEQLGGTLLVESTPGEGTTIVAELPVEAAEGVPDAVADRP